MPLMTYERERSMTTKAAPRWATSVVRGVNKSRPDLRALALTKDLALHANANDPKNEGKTL